MVGADTPALRWQLREFSNLRFAAGLASPPAETAVLAPIHLELPLGETYTGQDFVLTQTGLPLGLKPRTLLEWLVFRTSAVGTDHKETLILWVRNEEP